MRKLLLLSLLVTLTLGLGARDFVSDSVRVDGYVRHFRMYLPQGLKADAPLVFSIHGYSSPGEVDDIIFQAADRHGFAVCVPLGLVDPAGNHSWNVGYPMQDGWKVDDEKALCRMARFVQKKYRLSRRNTFLSGMSNGGEVCYLLAYSNQRVFKAFGSIAGLTMQWIYRDRRVERPVPFLELHGTADQTSLWNGDLQNKGGWNPYMPVPIAVNAMVAADRCQEELTDTLSYPDRPGHRTIIRHRYVGGKDGTEVWLYQILGAGHCYFTDDMDTGEVIWQFFSKYVKN